MLCLVFALAVVVGSARGFALAPTCRVGARTTARSGLLDMFSGGVTPPAPTAPTGPARSWEEIGEAAHSAMSPALAAALAAEALDDGRGPPSVRATVRLFDLPAGVEPEVTLYRDHAAWCPYCMKVILLLEEKRIPYTVEKVPMRCYGDKPAWYTNEVSRNGLLPAARIRGRIVTESDTIIRTLDELYRGGPHPDVLPEDGAKAALVRPLLSLERRLFSAWLGWLTAPSWAGGGASLRSSFEEALDETEAALARHAEEGPYFLGADHGIVDIMFAPFLERIAASVVYFKGVEVRRADGRWPALQRWFSAMETRPPYLAVKGDYYSHCHDLPPQLGGCAADDAGAAARALVDGTGGGWAWAALEARKGDEEVVSPPLAPAEAAREAAWRLSRNGPAVAKFGCRALGSAGTPVMAELSGPNATPEVSYVPHLDSALRLACVALLDGPAAMREELEAGGGLAPATAAALDYVRKRVGVPRDMSMPAAQQLRAAITEVLGAV